MDKDGVIVISICQYWVMVPLVNFKFWMIALSLNTHITVHVSYDLVFYSLLMSSSLIHGYFVMTSGTHISYFVNWELIQQSPILISFYAVIHFYLILFTLQY